MADRYVYMNDRIVPRAEARISVFDHGFLYGDGIYETMRSYSGVIFLLDEHLDRLDRSAGLIGLSLPLDRDRLKTAMFETLAANRLADAYIRLTVSRGPGPIGLDPELCSSPTLVIVAEEMKEYPPALYRNGVKVIIAHTRRNLRSALNPQIKSLNFLNNILAKIETKGPGAYEAVMLNSDGHLAEGTISNIFFFREGVLCTPSVECGILDGITRNVVMKLAVREGLEVREGLFAPEDLAAASEAFLTNTTMEVMPVSNIDSIRYETGDIARLLRHAYREEVAAYVAEERGKGPSVWAAE